MSDEHRTLASEARAVRESLIDLGWEIASVLKLEEMVRWMNGFLERVQEQATRKHLAKMTGLDSMITMGWSRDSDGKETTYLNGEQTND